MEKVRWKVDKIIDAHGHYAGTEPVPHYHAILEQGSFTKVCLLVLPQQSKLVNPMAIERKKEQPHRFYIFGGLDHDPEKISKGDGSYLVDQVKQLLASGFDGIKMYEGHPGGRISWMPHKLDHGYFKPFWEFMAEHKVPITSHLANPVEYWKDESLKDAYKNGAPQEEYFRQAEAVLEKYPTLQISYAHFMFMGPQLDRLGKLFARFSGLRVDLAPGGEYFYYLSDNVSKAREFFIQWQDRILLGTDISDRNAMRLAHAKTDVHRLFLETDETFVLPSSTAMDQPPAAGSNGRTELHGLNLPLAVLEKIMGNNFEVFAGKDPKPLPQK